MHFRLRVAVLAVVCLFAFAASGRAQDGEIDPSERARFQFGPLRFTPSIVFSDLGVDDNVFNEEVDQKKDTTAAVGPAADFWLRVGPSRLSGKVSGQYLYFKQYKNQRSWNSVDEARWELPLARITPFVTGSLSDTKQRPGYEIDSRARLDARTIGIGSSLRLTGKTSVVLAVKRTAYAFDDTESFLGIDLAQQLNRRTDSESLDARFRLTPLTTFVVRSEATQERFDVEQLRNADSYSVMPGFELRPQALISGEAFVGVKRFKTLSTDVPDFTGVVSDVKVRYTVAATQVALNVMRDLTYSYEIEQPYYALTDAGVEVTERITHGWDVVGRTSRQTLAYRNNTALASAADRTDHGWLIGTGVGYRVGETLRLGFDVNYYRRQVDTQVGRSYRGLRFGASLSYGLSR